MPRQFSFGRYSRYFIVGGAIGVTSTLLLEFILRVSPTDTAVVYGLSVAIVYAIGVLAGFILHHRFTFQDTVVVLRWHRLGQFFAIAVLGALLTSGLSVFIRFVLNIDRVVGEFAGATAFVVAALTVSVVTYWLNARFVFSAKVPPQSDNRKL